MKNQTAVEYLYERLEAMIPRTVLYSIDKKKYFEQAKAMEKMQIIEAYKQGEVEWEPFDFKTAQDYYNEIYK